MWYMDKWPPKQSVTMSCNRITLCGTSLGRHLKLLIHAVYITSFIALHSYRRKTPYRMVKQEEQVVAAAAATVPVALRHHQYMTWDSMELPFCCFCFLSLATCFSTHQFGTSNHPETTTTASQARATKARRCHHGPQRSWSRCP